MEQKRKCAAEEERKDKTRFGETAQAKQDEKEGQRDESTTKHIRETAIHKPAIPLRFTKSGEGKEPIEKELGCAEGVCERGDAQTEGGVKGIPFARGDYLKQGAEDSEEQKGKKKAQERGAEEPVRFSPKESAETTGGHDREEPHPNGEKALSRGGGHPAAPQKVRTHGNRKRKEEHTHPHISEACAPKG